MPGVRKYPLWYVEWVRDHAAEYTTKEMAAISEQETGIAINYKALHNIKTNNHIKSVKMDKPGLEWKVVGPEAQQFIRDNAWGRTNMELADLVNERFGTELTSKQVSNWKKSNGVRSGLTGHLHTRENPGPDPHFMKGKPSKSRAKFKKGNIPHNTLPVGSRVLRDRAYWWVKIAEPDVWKQEHILVWEAAHGPLPPGAAVKFLDGDHNNTALENLEIVYRDELLLLNMRDMNFDDPEMNRTAILYARTARMAAKKRKELKQK